MENQAQTNPETMQIQGLLDRYLRFRSSSTISEAHMDEDSLNAFVEGRLNPRETAPILKHLTACHFCLNVTAELASLESQFSEAPVFVSIPETEPAKVADVLKGILSRIFGSPEETAVFAHEEKEEIEEQKKEDSQ